MTCLLLLVLLLLTQPASALIINEVEPNNSVATAQNIDAFFSLDFSPDIGTSVNTSTLYPHVTILGTNNDVGDFYSFTAPAGSVGVFDVDFATFDSVLYLYTATGILLHVADDIGGGGDRNQGETNSHSALLGYLFPASGLYVIELNNFGGGAFSTGLPYTLQVSIQGHPAVPEPSTVLLFASGLLALYYRRTRLCRNAHLAVREHGSADIATKVSP